MKVIRTMNNLNKGDSDKYHDGEGKMDAIWLKVRITTKESGTWTIETGTGSYRNRNFRDRKKVNLESPLHGLTKERIYYSSTSAFVYWRLVNESLVD